MRKVAAPQATSDINVTPMVDIMLVLLIIFMVITPMLQKGVSVTKAKSVNAAPKPDADKEDAVLVSITRDGRTFLGSTPTQPADLPNKVKDMLTNKISKEVYINADARARYEVVVDVVDNLRAAGVDELGLLTDQQQKADVAPAPKQ
jgi:biopolymer transport protein ExbD